MSNPLTEARQAVTAALNGVTGLTVHAAVPQVVSPPAAWVTPAEPWLEPVTLSRTQVSLDVSVAVSLNPLNAQAALDAENRVWQVVTALRAAGLAVLNATVPTPTGGSEQNVAISTINTVVHVDD